MSLINQMLKDLSKRSKPSSDPNIVLLGLSTAPSPSKRKFKYKTFMMILLLLVSTTFFFMKYLAIDNTQKITPKLVSLSDLKSVSKPQQKELFELPIKPVTLAGITLQVKNDLSNLRLLLGQNTLYRVTGNGNDRLLVVLENTRLLTNLPQIDTMNSAIKAIRMINEADGSLKILITLNQGAELKQLEINDIDASPELHIDLWYNPMVANAQNTDLKEGAEQITSIKKISYNTAIDDEYQQAMQYIDQRQPQEAIRRLSQFLEKYPKFAAARKSLATILMDDSKIVEAQQIIDVGLEQIPFYPPYVQLKAKILVAQGKVKNALNLLLKAPPTVEENPEIMLF